MDEEQKEQIQYREPLRRPIRPLPEEQEKKRERISKMMAILLVSFAILVDLSELVLEWLGIGLLGLSSLISLSAGFIFWIWLKSLGVSFIMSPRRFATMGITWVAEIIPGFDALGGFLWTIGIILLVVMVRSEDKGGVVGKALSAAESIADKKPG